MVAKKKALINVTYGEKNGVYGDYYDVHIYGPLMHLYQLESEKLIRVSIISAGHSRASWPPHVWYCSSSSFLSTEDQLARPLALKCLRGGFFLNPEATSRLTMYFSASRRGHLICSTSLHFAITCVSHFATNQVAIALSLLHARC